MAPSRLSTPFPSRLLPRLGLGKAYVHEMYMHATVTNGGRVACMRLRARPRRLLRPSFVAPWAAPTSARARVRPPRLCSHRPREASLPCFTDASPRPPGLLPTLGWMARDGDGAPPPPHGQDRMYQPMMGYARPSPATCSMYQPPSPFLFLTVHHQASPYLSLSSSLIFGAVYNGLSAPLVSAAMEPGSMSSAPRTVGGKGLGKGSVKRHRKVLWDNIQGS